jgi:hypothetical protein
VLDGRGHRRCPEHAGLDPRSPVRRVDPDAVHSGRVDQDAALHVLGGLVPAGAYRHRQPVPGRESHRRLYVGRAGHADGDRRA